MRYIKIKNKHFNYVVIISIMRDLNKMLPAVSGRDKVESGKVSLKKSSWNYILKDRENCIFLFHTRER